MIDSSSSGSVTESCGHHSIITRVFSPAIVNFGYKSPPQRLPVSITVSSPRPRSTRLPPRAGCHTRINCHGTLSDARTR
eukprot:761462-Hanusia_phi.AAC.1